MDEATNTEYNFSDCIFKSNNKDILIKKCPINLNGFKRYGIDETEVCKLALRQIVYHKILTKVRAENLTEVDFYYTKSNKPRNRNELKEKLFLMKEDTILYLNSEKEVIQAFNIAKELGKKITIYNEGSRLKVILKTDYNEEKIEFDENNNKNQSYNAASNPFFEMRNEKPLLSTPFTRAISSNSLNKSKEEVSLQNEKLRITNRKDNKTIAFRDDLRLTLEQLQDGMVLFLDTYSNVVQARIVANEMGKKIESKKLGDGRWAVKLKKGKLLAIGYVSNTSTDARLYTRKLKHWEHHLTPIGRSGIPREGLAFYAQGHQDIPQEWMVYVEDFDIIFKPRYVRNPVELLNDKLIQAGLHPTRFMLSENYERLPEDEEEKRFNFIRERYTE